MSKISEQKTLLWLAILAIGIGLLFFAGGNEPGESNLTETPQATPTSTPSSTPNGDANRTPFPTQLSFMPATCQVEGKLVFLERDLYRTEGAKIKYQNIDDVTRQIYWDVVPNDGALVVGPNLFEQLVIPNGEREVGAALYKDPTAKTYTLTARVTYGVPQAGKDPEVKEVQCTGSIFVEMP